jgi:predicted GNAT family N-acyltransferase
MKIIPVDNSDPDQVASVQAIRFTVFVEEQNCDPQLEMEEIDKTCQHWLAIDEGRRVGTARCIPYKDGTCKIGRVAVLKQHRGRGIGALLMQAILQFAQEAGYTAAILHAQCDKEAFYNRVGFTTTDATVFYEDNIPHVRMQYTFNQ